MPQYTVKHFVAERTAKETIKHRGSSHYPTSAPAVHPYGVFEQVNEQPRVLLVDVESPEVGQKWLTRNSIKYVRLNRSAYEINQKANFEYDCFLPPTAEALSGTYTLRHFIAARPEADLFYRPDSTWEILEQKDAETPESVFFVRDLEDAKFHLASISINRMRVHVPCTKIEGKGDCEAFTWVITND
jgi:hypothetical protein